MDYEQKLIYSGVFILSVLLLKTILIAIVKRRPVKEDSPHRRWINTLKNLFNFIILIGLLILWLSELRFFAISIAAFVVAIVLATREYIQCFLGAFYLASSRPFNVGDWIQINSFCGEAVSRDWFCTTILEVDIDNKSYAFTGRTLHIPNNRFITNPVANLNFMRRYIEHTFSIVRADSVNVFELKEYILERARQYCAEFQDVAERYNSLIETRLGVKIPLAEPSIRVSTTDLGKNIFSISIFCPTEQALKIEQGLTEDFLAEWYRIKLSKELKPDSLGETD